MTNNLTGTQRTRQNYVDNMIQSMLIDLRPSEGLYIDWDISRIAKIRDAIFAAYREINPEYPEMKFYPYIENEG